MPFQNSPQNFSFPIVNSVTANPTQVQSPDGTSISLSSGRQGDLLVSEVHGKYYNATRRGNVYVASAATTTGVSPLAFGGTTSGFMFYNPAGSGVLMEIIKIRAIPLTATDVVGVIGLEYGAVPTAVGTAAAVAPLLIGGQNLSNLCKASYGSTIVAMTFLQWLDIGINTTGGLAYDGNFEQFFDGLLVLAPGSGVNICSTTTQSTNKWSQDVTWAEWLI